MRVKNSARVLAAAAAIGGAVAAVRAKRSGSPAAEQGRWHVVTVGRPRTELLPDGKLPPPLDGLGDDVEIRCADAPGGRGTEIAARRKGPGGAAETVRSVKGSSTDQRIRTVLREFKQLIETDEVLSTEGQPHGRRRLGGRALGLAGRRAAKEGLL